jgi:hypothetical protein
MLVATVGFEYSIKLEFCLREEFIDEYAGLCGVDCTETLCLVRRIGPTDPYPLSDAPTSDLSFDYYKHISNQITSRREVANYQIQIQNN